MIHDDLFAAFDRVANQNDWRFLGQPEQYTRRYGKDTTTVRIYSNHTGTAITRVTRAKDGRLQDSLGTQRPRKRQTALLWLAGKA